MLLGSFVQRPYVFFFLALSLAVSSAQLGYRRTALLFLLAWGVAFLSEFSSTRNGIPYGYYEYLATTRDSELWIANVPFFDSLSYTFITYSAYATALLAYSPLLRRGADVQLVDTHRLRRSWPVALLGIVFVTCLDIVVDPVALRGSRWFLGQIFWYPTGGLYFGVPLSNFVGWAIVGATIILLFQRIDRFLVKRGWMSERGVRHMPAKAVLGPGLYAMLLVFNLTITFAIGEPLLGCVGLFIFTPITMLLIVLVFKPAKQATAEEVEAHIQDFPASPLGSWLRSSGAGKGEGDG